jgi:hypothetical protein
VTLTGPGGVGKSRLAVEAARRLAPRFADGVRFVDLASVSSGDLVAAAVATGLGLTTTGDKLITDLRSYLRAPRLLLVLDNFEQVVGAAPLLAELLGAAPGVVVLVTSRVVLRLSGEHEFAVPPLPVPPAVSSPDPEELQAYASVGLFVQRARAVAPGFELTGGNAEAVAEILVGTGWRHTQRSAWIGGRLRSVVIVRPRLESSGPRGPFWPTARRVCSPSAVQTCRERRHLDADDALTCSFRGGGEGI